jgi:hypothetical protein
MPYARIPIPLLAPIHDPFELFKAALKVFVAAERALDGPEALAHGTTV